MTTNPPSSDEVKACGNIHGGGPCSRCEASVVGVPTGQHRFMGMLDETNFRSEPAPVAPPERKPIVMLDSERLKPIDQEMLKEGAIECDRCRRPEARWAFLPTESGPDDLPQPICSYCFLYESGWGLVRRDQLDQMVKDVEEAMGVVFARDPGGRMTNPRDADRILGAIAYISRIYALRNAKIAQIAREVQNAPKDSRIIQPAGGGSGLIVSPMGSQFREK